MLQAKMTEPGKIIFEDVPMPETGENEVLVKVVRIGVCGSDMHVYHGKHPYTSYPVIQGHEVSGIIVKKGKEVNRFDIGDRVIVQPQVVCGNCFSCRQGNYHICDNLKVMGFQTEGWAMEYQKVKQEKVLKIPDKMSYDQGALVEPAAVACHALRRSKLDLKDKNIIVLGAGTIGNLVGQVARAKGARVIITDISEFRTRMAEKCGIDIVVNSAKNELEEVIKREYGLNKADLILECVGRQQTINQAVDNARKGTDIIVVGVFPDNVSVNMGLVQDRELRLIGTLMYKEEDFLEAIELISRNMIEVEKLITDHFNFIDYDMAYQQIEELKDRVMKVLIKLDDGNQ